MPCGERTRRFSMFSEKCKCVSRLQGVAQLTLLKPFAELSNYLKREEFC